MTLDELIAGLQKLRAIHGGDVPVLSSNAEGGYDEHDYLRFGQFVPSGYTFAGGDWVHINERPHSTASQQPAVFLTSFDDD